MNWKSLLTNPFVKKDELPPLPVDPPPDVPQKEPKAKKSKELSPKAKALMEKVGDYKSVLTNETKLTEDQQLEMIEMIARFWPTQKIVSELYERHKVQISPALIYQYKHTKKWIPVIKKLREKYVTGVDEVAGTHKRVRLERAEEIYNNAIKSGKLRIALAANKDQREEVFEKQAGSTVYNLNQFNQYVNMTDEELEEKKKEIILKMKKAEVITDGKA